MVELKYFIPAEFSKAQPACSIHDMDEYFLQRLDKARDLAGVPFIINSAYRSEDYELAHGRFGSSAHCLGVAVDIRCTDSYSRGRILSALIKLGFTRIGIAPRFIHVDSADDMNLSNRHFESCIWLYDTKSNAE